MVDMKRMCELSENVPIIHGVLWMILQFESGAREIVRIEFFKQKVIHMVR
jgi:hypothetical protein